MFIRCVKNAVEYFMELGRRDAQKTSPADKPACFVAESLALVAKLAAGRLGADVGSGPVTAFEQAFGGQSLIDAEDRVLIHGQFAGELPDAGETITGAEISSRALGTDLIGDLPGDGDA